MPVDKRPTQPLLLDYDLWRLYSDTHRLIVHASDQQLARLGLSHETVAVLSAIFVLGDNVMPIDLSRVLSRKPQTITELITKLEAKKLVQKKQDETKKNWSRISLTDKGLAVFQKASNISIYPKVFKSLTAKKRKIFVECLLELQSNAQKNQ
jgi:DNA-binding MarR family transcriptional regulator